MRETRLALRYANALLEMATEKQLETRVMEDMKILSDVCDSNKDFRMMLSNPVINNDKKNAILAEIFKQKIDTLSLSFLRLITKKNRESHISEIAKKYIEIYKEYKGIKTAIIETPVKLDEEMIKNITEKLKHNTKSEIELIEKINKELIGGFRLTFDNNQYDTSILSHLQKLRREFNINVYEKGM